jgi:hypothetical protein
MNRENQSDKQGSSQICAYLFPSALPIVSLTIGKDPKEFFRNAVRKSAQTVTAYIASLKQLYPCEEGWLGGFLDLFTFS